MSINKKVLSSVLSAAMLLSVAAGCSSGSQPSNSGSTSPSGSASTSAPSDSGNDSGLSAPGEFPITQTPITLSVVAPDATYLTDLNENDFTKWYEEKTNIHVDYIQVPAQSKKEKVNLLLASGDYPDIIMNCGLTTADEVSYGAQKVFQSLNGLIDAHGFYLKDVFEQQSSLPGAITAPDGNIYALPNINDAFHTRHIYRAWINTGWLDKLGLSVPTTTDEFYNVLKAFKEQDPNGNGKADEIPMLGCNKNNAYEFAPYTFLMNSFVYFDQQANSAFLELDNGTVNFVATSDAYKDGLLYIKNLISEGLLDPTSLTQTEDEYKQIGTNPDAQMVGVGASSLWWKFLGYDKDTADQRANSYDALSPLKGPNGAQYSPITATAVGTSTLVLTNKCQYPEAALKWMDGLYSQEVTMRSQFGIEGKNWEFAPEGSLGIDQKPAVWHKIADFVDGPDPSTARNTFPGNRTSELRLGEMTDYSDPNAIWTQEPRLYSITNIHYYPFETPEKQIPQSIYYTADESNEYSRLKEQINTYARESLVAFITGNRDLEKEWDSYVKEFEKLELPKYLEYVQKAYDRQYK